MDVISLLACMLCNYGRHSVLHGCSVPKSQSIMGASRFLAWRLCLQTALDHGRHQDSKRFFNFLWNGDEENRFISRPPNLNNTDFILIATVWIRKSRPKRQATSHTISKTSAVSLQQRAFLIARNLKNDRSERRTGGTDPTTTTTPPLLSPLYTLSPK